MARNLHLTLEPGQWAGPGPAQPDGSLELQIVHLGQPRDEWVPVVCGWAYGREDEDVRPADGVWVAIAALPGSA